MRSTLPTINLKEIQLAPRKVTGQNLDSLYASIILILNLHPCKSNNELQAVLTALHNHMLSVLDVSSARCIALYKSLSRWFVEYLRGERLGSDGFDLSEWDPVARCPTVFCDLIPLFDSFYKDKTIKKVDVDRMTQCIYAVLQGHRVIVLPGQPNYDTITKPLSTSISWASPDAGAALSAIGITPEAFQAEYARRCASFVPYVMTSGGPNGQATWSAHLDAEAILQTSATSGYLKDFLVESELLGLLGDLHSCVPAPDDKIGERPKKLVTGRLVPIEEWGGKTRIVAQLDYWTQMALSPLHDTIAHFLKLIPSDGTYNQTLVIDKVREWSALDKSSIHSFDLTAATDRLPITLQESMLAFLTGNATLAKAWRGLLTAREFACPDGMSRSYGAGQPMGAKSSFPMLALTHHFIIQSCALSASVAGFKDYVVVGDDVTLNDSVVATEYQSAMKSLDVAINLQKSFVPGVALKPAGEMCKRLFIKGVELTAFPVKLMVKSARFGYMASDLQSTLQARGSPILDTNLFHYMTNVVDTQSLKGLVLLNSVPIEVSGLVDRVDPNISTANVANWYPGFPLTEQDIIDAHTFATVCEQLKRVDLLLKANLEMVEIISTHSSGMPTELPGEFFSNMTEDKVKKIKDKLPVLVPTHPICRTAVSEFDRVTSLLAGLRSGAPEMVQKAKSGLLDLLRSSLTDIWFDDQDATSAPRRAIFNATLSAVERMCLKTKPTSREVSFSLLLTSVQRMWSVTWKLGHRPQLNIVSAKVNMSTIDAKAGFDKLGKKFEVKGLRI